MEIEILEKKDNLLLDRTEYRFLIDHPNEATPKRKDLKDLLKVALDVKKGVLVIDNVTSEFGKGSSRGFAKVYKTEEAAKKVESDHILIRNNLMEKK